MQYLVVSPLGESFESTSKLDDLGKEIERKLGYKVSQQHLTIDSEEISTIRRRRTDNSTRLNSTSTSTTPIAEEEPHVKVMVNPSWYPSFLEAYMALMRSVFDLILVQSESRFELVKKWHMKLNACHPLVKTFMSKVFIPFVSNLLLVFFGACLMGVCAQISISLPSSVSTVPVTGQTFGVLWLGSLTGVVVAPLSVILYLFCGAVIEIPWFSNQAHGSLVLFQSASSGFLTGFIFSALVCGWFCSKMASDRTIMMNLLMLCLSNAVTFVFGCAWLAFGVPNLGLAKGIEKGLVPFLPGETIKIALVLIMIRLSWFVLFRIRKVVLNNLSNHDDVNTVNEEGNQAPQDQTPNTFQIEDEDNRCLSTCSTTTTVTNN